MCERVTVMPVSQLHTAQLRYMVDITISDNHMQANPVSYISVHFLQRPSLLLARFAVTSVSTPGMSEWVNG